MGVCSHRDNSCLHVQHIDEGGVSHASRRLMGRQLPVKPLSSSSTSSPEYTLRFPTTTTHIAYTYMLLLFNEPS